MSLSRSITAGFQPKGVSLCPASPSRPRPNSAPSASTVQTTLTKSGIRDRSDRPDVLDDRDPGRLGRGRGGTDRIGRGPRDPSWSAHAPAAPVDPLAAVIDAMAASIVSSALAAAQATPPDPMMGSFSALATAPALRRHSSRCGDPRRHRGRTHDRSQSYRPSGVFTADGAQRRGARGVQPRSRACGTRS